MLTPISLWSFLSGISGLHHNIKRHSERCPSRHPSHPAPLGSASTVPGPEGTQIAALGSTDERVLGVPCDDSSSLVVRTPKEHSTPIVAEEIGLEPLIEAETPSHIIHPPSPISEVSPQTQKASSPSGIGQYPFSHPAPLGGASTIPNLGSTRLNCRFQASNEGASVNSYQFEEPIGTPQYTQLLSIPGGHHFPSVPLWPTPAPLDGASTIPNLGYTQPNCRFQASSEGALVNSYQFEEPIGTPQYTQLLSIPGGHHFPSVPLWPTPVGFCRVEDPSSHIAQPLVQADLTTSGQTPNSGAEPNGSDIDLNINISRKNGKPVSSNQQIGPDRGIRTHPRRESNPYQRPTLSVTRKSRPVKHEDNLERLQQRCRRQGADEDAVCLLGKVFVNEVSEKALTRSLTDEVETEELGIVTGKVYTAFLEPTDEGEGAVPRYICRLCHSDQTWKHAKDVLRHLKRDHFGLADTCNKWYVSRHCYHKKNVNIAFSGYAASKSSILEAR